MRFASFLNQHGAGFGLVENDRILPIVGTRFADLQSVIAANAYAEAAAAATDPVAADGMLLVPTLPNPGKIICIGMNYVEHIKELSRDRPAFPTLFTRFPDSLVGHEQPVIRPRVSTHYDFEGELAVVIGRQARHVAAARALDFIAGYTCFLDGSVRDYQFHTSQFIAGKNFRHSGALGPWLVTADEIPDPNVLTLKTRVNGQVMQTGHIDDLCFDIGALIEYLSTVCQLEPGDVIATGSPSGIGMARDPQVWLQPGDIVEVDIDKIGVLRNEVVDEGL
ncbi:MAG: fumarylacetoacetate hydrolase family protein [Gammaproteobacteria bacterium]|jgi:2-keto-4-pentenoate hydratase/2-oxohepta-3-ene-1,7-dioic acid hydratase in catechol pathway|nr:5-oxopent-3-ene-1,2,5-tricarboxylate decarboxylase [Chromatiales bacterium]MCP4924346.1 fumarylacetoacetate hydrolase family protein [Gammaproteobacteria bacterium]MDP7154575.1 fumarylacetoacetate hydrolase family protein [Gammaproteobacteria bacterium]MDP7419155.1 fumarylacetoacetate hydrolase family protein [Gammaproteobacteria bacterium]MDP7659670.1 fumarylacetoacetate hydrolase family protein [Gammaproteobacteria bacterium]